MPKASKSKIKAKKQSKFPKLFGKHFGKPAVFVLLFALVGVGTLLLSFAAVPRGEIINKHYNECLENFFNRQINGNFLSVYPCQSSNNAQKWNIYSSDKSIRTDQGYCLDVKRVTNAQGVKVDAKAPGSGVHLWRCTGGTPQQWDILGNGTLRNPSSGLCLEAADKDTFLGGPSLYINTCNANNARQVWTTPSSPVPVPIPTPPPSNPPPTPPPPSSPACSVGNPNGRPGPENTGWCGSLTKHPGGTISQSMSNVEFTGGITITGNNVTLRNFKVSGGLYGINVKGTNVTLEDGEIYDVGSAGLIGSNYIARRIEIHESEGDGIKQGTNVVVERSWLYRIGLSNTAQGGTRRYGDCFQWEGAHNFKALYNFCDDTNHAPGFVNAAFQVQDGTTNVYAEGNWITGGNKAFSCKVKGSSPPFSANQFTGKNNIILSPMKTGVNLGCTSVTNTITQY